MADETRGHTPQNVIAESIRRHVVFVLVVAIAFTCAAVALTTTRHSHYTSTAKVLVTAIAGNPLSPDNLSSGQTTTVAMTTEAALVTGPEVYARAVADRKPEPVPPPSAVKAIVPPNTKIVQIRVTAGSPDLAANGAEAYAKAFLDYRTAQAQKGIDTEHATLEQQLTVANAAFTKARDNASKPNPPVDAQTQLQLAASRVATITSTLGDLGATDTAPGKVVSDAVPPDSPDGLNPILVVLAALVLGLGAGALLAIWRERRDDRIRNAYDHSVAGVPILAALPGNRRMSPRRTADLHADDPLRTSYRRARAGVIASAASPVVLVVSSVERGSSDVDPAGEVAANLGWSLTGAGFAVTVVDATIGLGEVAELLGVATAPGLTEQLIAKGTTAPPVQETLGMSVVPAGRNPEAAREFYAGARLAKSLAWFTEGSDYLIVAGPPAATPDGEAVALVGDALLLVVVDKETTHRQMAAVLERADQLSVRVIGAVGLQRRETPRSTRASRRKRSRPEVVPPRPVAPRTGTQAQSAASRPAGPKPTVSKPAGSLRGDDGR
jgi:polysaccharide biosynthesis transport protein